MQILASELSDKLLAEILELDAEMTVTLHIQTVDKYSVIPVSDNSDSRSTHFSVVLRIKITHFSAVLRLKITHFSEINKNELRSGKQGSKRL